MGQRCGITLTCQSGGSVVPAVADRLLIAGSGPSQRSGRPDGPASFSMDNPEYHMVARNGAAGGSLPRAGSLTRRGGGGRRRNSSGGAQRLQAARSSQPLYPAPCVAPPGAAFQGAAPPGAAFQGAVPGGPVYGPSVSGVPPGARAGPVRRPPPHEYYNELELAKPRPPQRRSETTV